MRLQLLLLRLPRGIGRADRVGAVDGRALFAGAAPLRRERVRPTERRRCKRIRIRFRSCHHRSTLRASRRRHVSTAHARCLYVREGRACAKGTRTKSSG